MKDFYYSIEKMGRSGNEKDGYNLEVDDNVSIQSGLLKHNSIKQVVNDLIKEYPELKIEKDDYDEVDSHFWRVQVSLSCKHYKNTDGLYHDSVGLVCVEVQHVFVDEDGEILFYNESTGDFE